MPIEQGFDCRDSPVTKGCKGFYYERESFTRWRTNAPQPASVELALLPGTFDHPAIVNRPISRDPSSDLGRHWISNCSLKHPGCSPANDRPLPTKLLEVSPGQEPRLVVTMGSEGQYVALSHCWGTSKPPMTTPDSFASFLECIPFDTLPRTFRDAVTVVQQLEYTYLWIDCFCIIQGSAEDFQYECAQMHATFTNAAVTITGPAAPDTSAGLLHYRETWDTDPTCDVLLPY